MKLSKKQKRALGLLTDSHTKNIGYGGAAYGGKSVLGVYAMILLCSELNGSKWFIGRDQLKETRESVLFTFRKVSKMLGFKNWRYKDDKLYFTNGSEIEFLDLSFMPNKDPLYERFGSKEYTGGWIEEAGNVHYMAYEVLKTRVGRWYNIEFGMVGKILVTFNPKKNWVDRTFYRPWKTGKEAFDTKFIRALATDNIDPDHDYLNSLRNIKDKATRERLWLGNFDYDDDPTSLLSYETISNIWTNTHIIMNHQDKCLVADIARFGSDDAIIAVFYGFQLYEYHVFDKSSTVEIQNCINAMRRKHGIPASRCVADEDGVGGGVVDNCGIYGFVNGSRPMDDAYRTLKDECGYLLAEYLQAFYFHAEVDEATKGRIEEELGQLKTYKNDDDGKLRILPKVKIKENIGRSPDWLDVFIMRMFFIVGSPEQWDIIEQKALKNLG